MVIDLFLGYNEFEIAAFRVGYLSDEVAHTIIAESSLSHSGIPKPLFFKEWLTQQTKSFQEKITVLEIPLLESDSSWEREIKSREYLASYAKLHFPGKKFILSDLDEIPSRSQVIALKQKAGLYHFLTPTYYRRINWGLTDKHKVWARGVMGDLDSLTQENGARFSNLPLIEALPGMHLSYLGMNAEGLSNKLTNFAHTEFKNMSALEEEFLAYCDKYAIDHLGRAFYPSFGILEVRPPNELEIPEVIDSQLRKYIDHRDHFPRTVSRIWASFVVSRFILDLQSSRRLHGFEGTITRISFIIRVIDLGLRFTLGGFLRHLRGRISGW